MNPPHNNRNWIWLFVVLAILSGSAIAINLAYNMQQQLKMQDLQAARALWDKHGPKNYDLAIRKEIGVDKSNRDVVKVYVRAGKTVAVTLNGVPSERRFWAQYDVPGVFDWIEVFLEMDAKPDALRTFCRARFDPVDGHIIHFVRSVRGAGQRQELTIELTKANLDSPVP